MKRGILTETLKQGQSELERGGVLIEKLNL
jgi:hypothetical protein